jgi:hypothetical protein
MSSSAGACHWSSANETADLVSPGEAACTCCADAAGREDTVAGHGRGCGGVGGIALHSAGRIGRTGFGGTCSR